MPPNSGGALATSLGRTASIVVSHVNLPCSTSLAMTTAVMAFVSVLDYGFGHLVLLVFGGGG